MRHRHGGQADRGACSSAFVLVVGNGVASRRSAFLWITPFAAVPSFPVLSTEVGPFVVLTLFDHLSPDGAGAGEQVEQSVPVA